jgi:hypothetical protein
MVTEATHQVFVAAQPVEELSAAKPPPRVEYVEPHMGTAAIISTRV